MKGPFPELQKCSECGKEVITLHGRLNPDTNKAGPGYCARCFDKIYAPEKRNSK